MESTSAESDKSRSFLEAAELTLKKIDRPLTALEIVHEATKLRLLVSNGKTPHKTMQARLSIDILNNKQNSKFVRLNTGLFGLRENIKDKPEYVAPRRYSCF
jgi:HB1, ASXL, restriction endonuclease HTH domain